MSGSLQSSFAHAVSLAGIHSRAHFATSSTVCPSDLRGKLPWRVCVRAVCTPTSEFIHQPHSVMRLTCTMRCFRCPREETLRNAPSSWPSLRPRHGQRYASVWAVILKCFNCWEILLPFWNDWDMFFSSPPILAPLNGADSSGAIVLCLCEWCTALDFIWQTNQIIFFRHPPLTAVYLLIFFHLLHFCLTHWFTLNWAPLTFC